MNTFLFSFLLLICSCKKDKRIEELITYSYSETQCADPWHDMSNAFERTPEERVAFYLDTESIEYSNLTSETYGEGMLFCLACDCASGIRFTLTASNEYESLLNSIGFQAE